MWKDHDGREAAALFSFFVTGFFYLAVFSTPVILLLILWRVW